MNTKALILGAALAGIVATAHADKHEKKAEAAPTEASGECSGINSCKGKGACGGKDKTGEAHSCAGKNACKGQGWVTATEKDCKAKKGTWKPG